MANSVPLLRPPIPGTRNSSGNRTPRLGLAIPPSPNVRPVDTISVSQAIHPVVRPGQPSQRIEIPPVSGQYATTLEGGRLQQSQLQQSHRPPPLPLPHVVNGSSGETSAQDYARIGHEGGVGVAREGSLQLLPDFEKESLDKGRPLDVEDLDDAGWGSASRDDLIEELGSLGEGASGAVIRARLKGGNTVFALKVGRTRWFARSTY